MAYCSAFQCLFSQLHISSAVPAERFLETWPFEPTCGKKQTDCSQGFCLFDIIVETISTDVIG